MKHVIIILILMANSLYGFGGLGITGGTSSISHGLGGSPLTQDGLEVGSFNHESFDGTNSIGAYLYVDAIPFIDIDLELNAKFSPYKYNFIQDHTGETYSGDFGWISTSFYLTAQRSIFKFSVPFLAKVKLSAGAGINNHNSTPMINQQMLHSNLEGDLKNGEFNEDSALEYLKDNRVKTDGFHIQMITQFKLLVFDSMLVYRYVFSDGITPETEGFGDLNLRIGYGL